MRKILLMILTSGLTLNGVNNAMAQNLITNGDFESGNTGFTTGYTQYTNTAADYNTSATSDDMGAGLYDVSIRTHNSSFQPGDHTLGNGGMAMWVDGGSVPTTVVWSQTVAVSAGTSYAFSTWVKAIGLSPAPGLRFYINGTAIGTFAIANADMSTSYNWGVASAWEEYLATWTAGSGVTTAVITITDDSTVATGNDFGLDDISFIALNPPTRPGTTPGALTLSVTNNCGTSTITVSGMASGCSINWSGPSTPSGSGPYTVSTAGVYSATQTAGTCTSAASNCVTASLSPYVCGTGSTKVQMCHWDNGHHTWQTLSIDPSSIRDHLSHSHSQGGVTVHDYCGPCASGKYSNEEPAYDVFNLYPNPATNKLNVVVPLSDDETQVMITDLTGHTIAIQTIAANTTTPLDFNIADIPAGMYIVKAKADGATHTGKFVKD